MRADWIGFASATSRSNRCVAIFAISISAAACSWVGELFSRSQPCRSSWSMFSLVAHGHDQREAESVPVGLGQRRQLLVLRLGEPGQPKHRLVGLGVLALLAHGHRHRPEIGVGADELRLLLRGGREQRLLEGPAQVLGVGERAPGVGPLDHPVRALEQPGEGAHELLRRHVVHLVQPHQASAGCAGHGRAAALADVVEHQVEPDRGDAAQGDPAAQDDLRPFRHRLGHVGLGGHVHGQAHAGGHDDHVAVVVEVHPGQGLEADHGHRGEHGQRGPAEHRVRDAGHDRRRLRQQPEDDHDHPGRGHHVAALDPGQPDQADVLGEAGVRERVQDAANHGGQAVGAQRAGDVLAHDALLHDLAGGEHVTGGLDGGDQHDHDHRDDGGQRELGRSRSRTAWSRRTRTR